MNGGQFQVVITRCCRGFCGWGGLVQFSAQFEALQFLSSFNRQGKRTAALLETFLRVRHRRFGPCVRPRCNSAKGSDSATQNEISKVVAIHGGGLPARRKCE